MKICYIADAASVHTRRWISYFADQGHEVQLISFGPTGPNLGLDNVKLNWLKKLHFRPLTLLGSVFEIRKLLRKLKPDILHAHYLTIGGLLGALSGFHPLVVTAWGSDVLIAPKHSWMLKFAVRFALYQADLITCDARHVREALIRLGALPASTTFIQFGVDVARFRPGIRNEKSRRFRRFVDSPVVLSLRHLEPLYDLETLIECMPEVLREFPGATLLILGKGTEEDRLRRLAATLGVAESIRFMGQIPYEQMPEAVASADLAVSVALSDAGPGGIMEAMACGLPVITTDCGESRKWIEDGINGYVIPKKSPKNLALKIVYLLGNQEVREKMGRANRKVILERNNLEKEMQKMLRLYEVLIEAPDG